ncbi:MAG: hypothetical protein Q9227_004715 [Pyrenula ochraceoflavens]
MSARRELSSGSSDISEEDIEEIPYDGHTSLSNHSSRNEASNARDDGDPHSNVLLDEIIKYSLVPETLPGTKSDALSPIACEFCRRKTKPRKTLHRAPPDPEKRFRPPPANVQDLVQEWALTSHTRPQGVFHTSYHGVKLDGGRNSRAEGAIWLTSEGKGIEVWNSYCLLPGENPSWIITGEESGEQPYILYYTEQGKGKVPNFHYSVYKIWNGIHGDRVDKVIYKVLFPGKISIQQCLAEIGEKRNTDGSLNLASIENRRRKRRRITRTWDSTSGEDVSDTYYSVISGPSTRVCTTTTMEESDDEDVLGTGNSLDQIPTARSVQPPRARQTNFVKCRLIFKKPEGQSRYCEYQDDLDAQKFFKHAHKAGLDDYGDGDLQCYLSTGRVIEIMSDNANYATDYGELKEAIAIDKPDTVTVVPWRFK